jgi:hypothetical protein
MSGPAPASRDPARARSGPKRAEFPFENRTAPGNLREQRDGVVQPSQAKFFAHPGDKSAEAGRSSKMAALSRDLYCLAVLCIARRNYNDANKDNDKRKCCNHDCFCLA